MSESGDYSSLVKNETGSSVGDNCSRGDDLTAPPVKKRKQTSITSFFQSPDKQKKARTSKSPSVIKSKEKNESAMWELTDGKKVKLDDSVKKLPGIGSGGAKKLLAGEIETIRDLKKKQLECSRDSDENSFINCMKQLKLSHVCAVHCKTEMDRIPLWVWREIKEENDSDVWIKTEEDVDASREIKEENDSDSDDIICLGELPVKSGHRTIPKRGNKAKVNECNELDTKIKDEKFTEVIEIIDLDLIDDDNSQNLNSAPKPANQSSSNSSSTVPETCEKKLDSNAQSADTNAVTSEELTTNGNCQMEQISNSKSKPTTSDSDKQPDPKQSAPLRIKSVSELTETASDSSNNNLRSVSTSISKPLEQVTKSNQANICENSVEPSTSRPHLERESEFSRQLGKENDKIQDSNSVGLPPQTPSVNETTEEQSLPQDKKSNQKSHRENLTELNNANAQSNRESLPDHNLSMTCSNQGSSTPTPRINESSTVQLKRKRVTGIADRLQKKRLPDSRNKINVSNENGNFNQVITPSASSKENCDENLPGNNSSESLEQTIIPSTSSDQHVENQESGSSSPNINPAGIENNLEELYAGSPVVFPGMFSTNYNNEGANINIDNIPASAPESVQEKTPKAPRQEKTASEKRRSSKLNIVKKLSNGTNVTPSSNPEKLTGVGLEGSARLRACRIKSIGALKKKQRKLGRAFVIWLEDVVKFERSDAEACEKLLKEIRWRL